MGKKREKTTVLPILDFPGVFCRSRPGHLVPQHCERPLASAWALLHALQGVGGAADAERSLEAPGNDSNLGRSSLGCGGEEGG